jgi:hypothetical protein
MPDILRIEEALKLLPTGDHFLEHFQIPGVYVRVLHIPAGTALTGKIHKTKHISILAHGEILIANKDSATRMTAPRVMIDEPGTKRLGYAVTDVTFINVLRTDIESVEQIENQLVCDTFEQYEKELLCLSQQH